MSLWNNFHKYLEPTVWLRSAQKASTEKLEPLTFDDTNNMFTAIDTSFFHKPC